MIDAYDAAHHPIDPPDPIEAMRHARVKSPIRLRAGDWRVIFTLRDDV
jgi:mRNA-degrading endonuclease RelE of RelBE toxin-antitoxin system